LFVQQFDHWPEQRPGHRKSDGIHEFSMTEESPMWGSCFRWRQRRVWACGPQHWSIVVIDIAGFGRWPNGGQLLARTVLRTAVRTALHAARVPRAKLAIEDRGDGMIVLVPASVSKADLLDPMIPRLATVLGRHNELADPGDRIRVRVAVHAGEVHRDTVGWVGTDLNTACRLVNGDAVYARLRRFPAADLVLVVSEAIHQGVVRHGYRRIDPETYSPVRITHKETNVPAWIHIPATIGRISTERGNRTVLSDPAADIRWM
jgi:class 3 adenylate cyclase